MMKSLSCADLGDTSCHFVAEGKTNEEVIKKMMKHVENAHPGKMEEMSSVMSNDAIMELMKLKIKTTQPAK